MYVKQDHKHESALEYIPNEDVLNCLCSSDDSMALGQNEMNKYCIIALSRTDISIPENVKTREMIHCRRGQ